MVGKRVMINSHLREEGIGLGFWTGVLEPIQQISPEWIVLTFTAQPDEIYPPVEAALDRHVGSPVRPLP